MTQLLHYHAEMIDTRLRPAFPKFRSPRLEQRRLALWISVLELTDGVAPPP